MLGKMVLKFQTSVLTPLPLDCARGPSGEPLADRQASKGCADFNTETEIHQR